MAPIRSEQELDDLLSEPSDADRAAMRAIEGGLLILGAGGKMGPSLARRARSAAHQAGMPAGTSKSIVAVSRFSNRAAERQLQDAGIETISADLLDFSQLARLPDAENVIFMAGRKFGSAGAAHLAHLTWASNAYLPARVATLCRRTGIGSPESDRDGRDHHRTSRRSPRRGGGSNSQSRRKS